MKKIGREEPSKKNKIKINCSTLKSLRNFFKNTRICFNGLITIQLLGGDVDLRGGRG